MVNLASNAIKNTLSGAVTIAVIREKLSSKDKNDYQLILKVIDTGIGIKRKHQTQLFKLFASHSHNDPSSVSRSGSGIGLVICKKILE